MADCALGNYQRARYYWKNISQFSITWLFLSLGKEGRTQSSFHITHFFQLFGRGVVLKFEVEGWIQALVSSMLNAFKQTSNSWVYPVTFWLHDKIMLYYTYIGDHEAGVGSCCLKHCTWVWCPHFKVSIWCGKPLKATLSHLMTATTVHHAPRRSFSHSNPNGSLHY